MLKRLRSNSEAKALARRLYGGVMQRARARGFYTTWGVADTIDGRFDLVVLHAWLVLEALGSSATIAQALVDEIFVGFDEALRELGVGDMGGGRRRTALTGAFYGRLHAYGAAEDAKELADAIYRNVYRASGSRESDAVALATYALEARSRLRNASIEAGQLDFGPLPERV